MRRPHVPASRESDAQSARVTRARPADRRPACGHARYTKGCDLCALAGIYDDHMSRPGLTAAERSKVTRLYLAGDKAGLFKLWQARPAADDS
jgi:hypothetical protein